MKSKHYIPFVFATLLILFSGSCKQAPVSSGIIDQQPDIFPDYLDVTIPSNIAPLNFKLISHPKEAFLQVQTATDAFTVFAKDGRFKLPQRKWKRLLQHAASDSIQLTISVKDQQGWQSYQSFYWYIAPEPVDPYLAYRLIPPGYELWNKMGIYQRNLENFDESAIIENKMTDKNCVNCHAFCMQSPEKMLFHMREKLPATVFVDNGEIRLLDTKTPETISSLVYPSWHPSGNYVAFSVNNTKQAFHTHNRNRVEVYDEASDVVVYDVQKQEIITSPLLFSETAFETFPTFSPDGKTLYFCSAVAQPMPEGYDQIQYKLFALDFDPDSRTFGQQLDSLPQVNQSGKSISFPRVSPDGRFLVYTTSGYGNFSIWHKDADLELLDLASGLVSPLTAANSEDVESYHSWSSNSKWLVFSSRRMDGLYTHPYLVYIDENGQAAKPFMLPQKNPDFYNKHMLSFNIPEFITGKVKNQSYEIALKAKSGQRESVKFINK